MKRVLLLGDSIRMGYDKYVRKMLEEECEVCYSADNGRFTTYTMEQAIQMFNSEGPYDIVHWNNGVWDICDLFDDGPFTTKEYYIATMCRIAGILQKKAKKVIFATTTPVRYENVHDKNERIIEFNEALVPELEKMGVQINDLHSLVYADINKYIRDDLIHLSEEGIDLCADAVVKAIKKAEAEL